MHLSASFEAGIKCHPSSIAASMTCLVFIKAIIMLFEIGTHGYLVLESTEGKVFQAADMRSILMTAKTNTATPKVAE